MTARFAMLRDAELSAYAWRFAVKRVRLAATVDVPAWGYSTIYARPSDDLRPLTVGGAWVDYRAIGVMYESSGYTTDQAWQIVEGRIHTNMSSPLDYEYVAQITAAGSFDALFVEALACRLASDACEELTQSASKQQAAEIQYRRAISEARRVNSLYEPPRRRALGRFMAARLY